ncbi:hypothetical protein [Enterococcus gallinarum]|uniref:hypothetical protein n=1 Tax=Enterococcus gallinarum TaxID=1353 RepID=UPI00243353D2|nr:hypothetical protein [Enterococcus gallinarum]
MKRITMIGLRSKTEQMMSNGEPSERDLEKNHYGCHSKNDFYILFNVSLEATADETMSTMSSRAVDEAGPESSRWVEIASCFAALR